MFESQAAVSKFLLDYLRLLVVDLSDEDLGRDPGHGMNSPVWILGHLAIMYDGPLSMLGKAKLCPESWHKSFLRGSSPREMTGPPPKKKELLDAIERGEAALLAALQTVDPALLAKPHPISILQKTPVKTIGDAATLVLTGHLGAHIGQLSSLRRMRGLPPLF